MAAASALCETGQQSVDAARNPLAGDTYHSHGLSGSHGDRLRATVAAFTAAAAAIAATGGGSTAGSHGSGWVLNKGDSLRGGRVKSGGWLAIGLDMAVGIGSSLGVGFRSLEMRAKPSLVPSRQIQRWRINIQQSRCGHQWWSGTQW